MFLLPSSWIEEDKESNISDYHKQTSLKKENYVNELGKQNYQSTREEEN